MSDDQFERCYEDGYDDGYDEGHADGQREANGAMKEAFTAIHKWLEERGILNWADYPDGLNANDLMDLIYEHERNLILETKKSMTQ